MALVAPAGVMLMSTLLNADGCGAVAVATAVAEYGENVPLFSRRTRYVYAVPVITVASWNVVWLVVPISTKPVPSDRSIWTPVVGSLGSVQLRLICVGDTADAPRVPGAYKPGAAITTPLYPEKTLPLA